MESFIPPERGLVYPLVVFAAGLVLTVFISAVSYEVLEKPFQRLKTRFTLVESRAT
jgi:peptidoglycan/LPS O-acetylase OafA/YrhL